MRRLPTLAAALVAVLALVPATVVAPAGDAGDATAANEEVETTETTVESFDGHEVPIKVYQPADDERHPTLLWGHGWAGSYGDSTDDGEFFAEHGYNVVAIDFRGHGEAREDSVARVHSPDYEIRDVSAVTDWIADRDFAELDGSDDPVLGAIGGSYGGGYQLLTAATDERLDAIAPEITWNDLPYALAPNGAVKSDWVDLLYGAGTAQASLAEFIHQGYTWANAFNEFPDGEDPGEPAVRPKFVASSPSSYPDRIDVPALVIQGLPDGLFNLNQAVDNVRQIEATTASPEVNLVTHLGGHIINTDGTLGADQVQVGIQPAFGPSPCGDVDDLRLRWFDDHLKDAGDDGIPRVKMALDDGTCRADAAVEEQVLGEAEPTMVDLEGPVAVTQGAPMPAGSVQVEEYAHARSVVQVDALAVDEATALTGVPTLSGEITVGGADAIVYLSLVVGEGPDQRVLNSQVTPLREDGPATEESFEVELGGVGAALDAGDTVKLEISSTHTQYAHNGERAPGAVVLENLELDLPVVPATAS